MNKMSLGATFDAENFLASLRKPFIAKIVKNSNTKFFAGKLWQHLQDSALKLHEILYN